MKKLTVPELFADLPKNETIYYCPNPGNAGDALIAAGTYLLMQDAGLKIQIVTKDNFNSAGQIVIYGGGGNLVGLYTYAREFIEKHHTQAKQLILLPHTVTDNQDLLSKLGSNVTLFARELVSHEYLLEHAKQANVYLNQDLALYVDPTRLLPLANMSKFGCILKKAFYAITGNNQARCNLPQLDVMERYSAFENKRLSQQTKVGNFFRTDAEKLLPTTPSDNMDLSDLYDGITHHKEICLYTVARLMKFINHFDEINTDRLHICIASALLGKKVNFHPNSYFKCKAIYDFSLKERFTNVSWCD